MPGEGSGIVRRLVPSRFGTDPPATTTPRAGNHEIRPPSSPKKASPGSRNSGATDNVSLRTQSTENFVSSGQVRSAKVNTRSCATNPGLNIGELTSLTASEREQGSEGQSKKESPRTDPRVLGGGETPDLPRIHVPRTDTANSGLGIQVGKIRKRNAGEQGASMVMTSDSGIPTNTQSTRVSTSPNAMLGTRVSTSPNAMLDGLQRPPKSAPTPSSKPLAALPRDRKSSESTNVGNPFLGIGGQSTDYDRSTTSSTTCVEASPRSAKIRSRNKTESGEPFHVHVKAQLSLPQSGGHVWHALYSGDQPPSNNRPNIPEDATAVIVIADTANVSAAGDLIRRLKAQRGMPPVVAMFVGSDGLIEESVSSVNVHRMFFSAGADDVVNQPACAPGPWLTVSASLLRIEVSRKAMVEVEDRLRDRFEEQLEMRLRAETQCLEPREGMFWRSVAKIYKELPPMEPDVTPHPELGCQVGCCRLEQLLGRGSCGDVYSATNLETGANEAVKVIGKDKLSELKYVEDLRKEIKVLRALKHKHVVICHGVIHGPGHLFLRMEKVGTCNLNRALKVAGGSFHVDAAKFLHLQVIAGLAYCHSKGVAHRDIKPENVGISDDGSTVKLLDFGSAAPSSASCCDMAGTMPFMAPEILFAEDSEAYDPSCCDVWSAGVVLLEMLCGWGTLDRMLMWKENLPPKRARVGELQRYFANTKPFRDYLEADLGGVDESLFGLLVGMLQVEMTRRITAAQIMESPWFSDAAVSAEQLSPE